MIRNLPAKWDLEADVVSVGSGVGGLSAAITAHDHGASALVLERSEWVGGVTALSLGEVWVAGNHHALGIGHRRIRPRAAFATSSASRWITAKTRRSSIRWSTRGWRSNTSRTGSASRCSVIRNCPDYYYGRHRRQRCRRAHARGLPFPAATLGEWQSRTRVSPKCPMA